MLTLNPFTVLVILSWVIPVLTGLITKLNAPDIVKGGVALTLSYVAAAVSQAVTEDGSAIFSQETLSMAALSYVIQLSGYLGLMKPLKINEKLLPTKGL